MGGGGISSRVRSHAPVALLALAAVVGVVLVLRSAGLLQLAEPDPAAALARQGERAYRAIPMFALGEAAGPAAIAEALGTRRSESPDADDRRAALIQAVSEFLFYRFGQDSIQSYKDWRRRSGYRMAPAAEMKRTWMIDSDYEAIFGEPYPGDEHLEAVFDRFWDRSADAGWESRVAGVASGSAGICIAFGQLTPGLPPRWPALEGELSADLWHGRRVASPRNWWRPQRTLEERLERHGAVDGALVGIILECADGSRKPYHFALWWDSARQVWMLVSVAVANYRDAGPVWEY